MGEWPRNYILVAHPMAVHLMTWAMAMEDLSTDPSAISSTRRPRAATRARRGVHWKPV